MGYRKDLIIMNKQKKKGRYARIQTQLEQLLVKTDDPIARMSSICAVLHHKMEYYFWTGFYLYKNGKLVVGPYQGPLACQELEKEKGVCWASVKTGIPQVINDVDTFPGHISCDSRSKSEITLPVFDRNREIRAIFDVDSDQLNSFTETDRVALEKIVSLIY